MIRSALHEALAPMSFRSRSELSLGANEASSLHVHLLVVAAGGADNVRRAAVEEVEARDRGIGLEAVVGLGLERGRATDHDVWRVRDETP